MWKNYFKIALRNLLKHRRITIINLLGLSIGIAAFLLIFLFVQYELSYDQYHTKRDRIYRVSREWLNDNKESNLHLGHLAPPFGPYLKADFPGIIEESVRLTSFNALVSNEEKDLHIVEEHFFFAEEGLFNIFSWNLIEGNAEILSDPKAVILTETAAKRYFGDEKAMGKTLIFEGDVELQVSGIMEDVPQNTHFHPQIIASFKMVEAYFGREQMMQNWGSNNFSTFLLLEEGQTAENLEAKIPGFIDSHLGEYNGIPASETNLLHLWPITDVHLYSQLDSEIEPNGDIKYVYIYSVIALFILIIACINFINLATARSMRRAREVGVRKVMGAFRTHLVRQFLTESILLTLLSLAIAIVLLSLILPEFNNFVQREIQFALNSNLALMALLIILLVGVVAGSYPAFILSSFQPSTILRASLQPKGKHPYLRSALVILQFTISTALFIGVITVEKQLAFMQNKSLNFNEKQLAVLPINETIAAQYDNIKDRLLQQEGVSAVSKSSRVPSGRLLDSQGIQAEVGNEMQDVKFRVADIEVDHDFFNTFEINFLTGRNFDLQRASDSTEAFIINASAVTAMGWTSAEEALGKKVNYGGGSRVGSIIGVVDDFHFESLHQPIAPIIFLIADQRNNNLTVRIDQQHWDKTIAYLKEQWSYFMPNVPFDYYKIEDRFQEQYDAEERLSNVVTYFSVFALIIAALGLIGLASFTAEQRFKEIGIRKIMGASVLQILLLFSKKFTVLVLVALACASFLAYYIMDKWLETFPYHSEIPWWSFVLAGTASLIVAWITVGTQTFKAANSNPVKVLRD